jgi:2-polyprenyl-6-methoxyphenol hydroxylase-like FAD-dependent oxidoreductase
MTSKPHIAIVGGGPGGLMLARLLLLRGFAPTVFERDRHAGDRPQGGSLDLHGDTGQRAMRVAGLENEFSAAARPEDQGDRLYDRNGTLLTETEPATIDPRSIGLLCAGFCWIRWCREWCGGGARSTPLHLARMAATTCSPAARPNALT